MYTVIPMDSFDNVDVLILVLMESRVYEIGGGGGLKGYSLNPCSNGIACILSMACSLST